MSINISAQAKGPASFVRSWLKGLADPSHRPGRCLIYARHGLAYLAFRRKLKQSLYGRIIPKNNPFFDRKFAAPYLASFLTPRQRLRIQADLCDYLDHDFGPADLTAQLADGIELWRKLSADGVQSLRLGLPERTMLEGDLTIEHIFNGERLHRLSFAIAPGHLFGLKDTRIAFIGGMQGVWGGATAARLAARNNGEINPANMTMIALRALCQSLGVTAIGGVRADCQPVIAHEAGRREAAYDLFWTSQHGEARPGFYLMPVDLSYEDDAEVGAVNRSRARRKRRLRMALTQEIRDDFDALSHGRIAIAVAAE